MSIVKFTETVFSSQNKEGILPPPDSEGYHTVILGGLNCYNSAGEYYSADGAIDIFRSSSSFMRRIKSGSLYSEVGHPRKEPGMSNQAYYYRIIDILDTNVCGHISDVTLDTDYGKNNPKIGNPEFIAVMGKVKPAGPKANTLELSFANKKQNTAFSVRGITENSDKRNRVERMLTQIVTYDHVIEPGIAPACKAYVPGLESFHVHEITDIVLDVALLKETLKYLDSDRRVATESGRALRLEILTAVSKQREVRLPKW